MPRPGRAEIASDVQAVANELNPPAQLWVLDHEAA